MKRKNPTLPAAILVFCFLMIWQGAAMRMNKAYILPSPLQVLKRLWELREPLFKAHLPATMQVVGIGLLISLVLGMALAVLMDVSPAAEQAGSGAAVRALVRLYSVEQGAGDGADDLFPGGYHSVRRL